MKNAHPYLKMAVVLASLAGLAWPVAAQTASTDNSAAAGKTATAQAASAQASTASGPIHYYFDEAPLDRSNRDQVASYADMLDKVTPGVVGIYPSRKIVPISTTTPRRGGRRGYNYMPPNIPPDMKWSDADSNQYLVMGVGSGCIISSDGYIVTNHHVVTDDRTNQPAGGFLVKLPDGREFEGKLIGSDEQTDLALIKIDAKNLPVIKMADSGKIKVGDVVFAVGNPMDVGLTVTHGIVSATGRSSLDLINDPLNPNASGYGDEDFIQTDAAINPGNSGGPLVDVQGRLIGLNTAIVSGSQDGGSIGIGFSIPSALMRKVVDDLITSGKVRRGALGVKSQEVTRDLAKVMGLPNTHGALIYDLDPSNGPAAKSGLKHGDVIVKLNSDEVDSPDKLHYLVALANPGSKVNLTVVRDGQPKVFNITLADYEDLFGAEQPETGNFATPNPAYPRYTPAPAPITPLTAVPAPRNVNEILEGVSLMPLTDELRQQMGLPAKDKIGMGLVVNDVARNSPYYYEFANRTVVITEVNQKPVTTLDQLRAALKPGAVNQFYVYRNDNNGGPFVPAYVTETLPPAN